MCRSNVIFLLVLPFFLVLSLADSVLAQSATVTVTCARKPRVARIIQAGIEAAVLDLIDPSFANPRVSARIRCNGEATTTNFSTEDLLEGLSYAPTGSTGLSFDVAGSVNLDFGGETCDYDPCLVSIKARADDPVTGRRLVARTESLISIVEPITGRFKIQQSQGVAQ